MAGWADSGSSRGRGGGGGFTGRGGANNNMNTRWRERRPTQLQHQHQHQQHQQQQHQQQQYQQHQHQLHQHQQHQHQQHRYRPVNDNEQSSHPHHPPAEELNRHRGQGEFSTSTRRPQPNRPQQARPTFTDHKSPAPPAANANANVDANEPDDKARRNAANFECNVCFDMADDPVVTKCGHLFCWECLYQWLHVHSHHRECPVCKGQVADDAIIPIYGRGGSAASVNAAPPRPTGARVESSRQQQQQAAMDWHMVDDDEDDNPFDYIRRLVGLSLPTDALLSVNVMPDDLTDIESYGDHYTNHYDHHHHHRYGIDEVFDLVGSQAFASAGFGPPFGPLHDDIMESFSDRTTHQEPDFVYRGGRRQRGRARGSSYADRSFEMVRGSSSSASYHDTGAGPHHTNNTGGSSRPNGGWTERRGRSNRNSNSGGGGRGTQNNSRRHGANYN